MTKRAVQIDPDTDAILTRLAKERAAEREAIVSDAVRLFDDLYGQAALDELDRRWTEFERTGESYTQDEVETWLKTWGTRDYRPFSASSVNIVWLPSAVDDLDRLEAFLSERQETSLGEVSA